MDPDASDEMVEHLVDFFDRIAPFYDDWAGGQHGRLAARLVDLATPAKGEQVLDVGTGTGAVAHLLAPRVNPGMVFGIDLSDRMLAIARARPAKNVQFVGMAPTRRPRSKKRTGCCDRVAAWRCRVRGAA
ncbi:MAG: methyltransferase domain-containing protein [Chloroflexi bacterium]|nr:MAG: methyltransferase domain-containing protein [Chloroflexota bacterium]